MLHFASFLSALLGFLFLIPWSSAASDYWVATIQRQGNVAFSVNSSTYPVYRNVADFGAKGDGVTDDTFAINNAINGPGYSATPGSTNPGYRCAGGDSTVGSYCQSSTIQPAMIYVPPGNYVVTTNIVMPYFTQLVGDALIPPTLFVNSTFKNTVGLSVLDADIYIPGYSGGEWYANQNNFYRQVRNFIIDMRSAPLTVSGIHWQVAQATSLQNITFDMVPKTTANNKQQGIFMENGSGGYMGDLVFNGGATGVFLGNQQFTSRNLVFNGCGIAIYMNFDWVWTFHGLNITNCDSGIDMTAGGFDNQAVGSVVVLDSYIGAATAIVTPYVPGYSSPQSAGTLVLDNVDLTASSVGVANAGGRVVLAGGQYIQLFAQGNAWTTAGQALNGQNFNATSCSFLNSSQTGYAAQETTIQRQLAPIPRPSSLVDSTGRYFARSKPQYETVPAPGFLSAKSSGCKGDGSTDDTAAVQTFLDQAAQLGQVAYFDHGAYLISNTIYVPTNLKITGECLPIIMATGSNFGDQTNPRAFWKVGTPGETGSVEMSDLIFESQGPVPGAIMIEWNIACTGPGTCGMWDVHWRMGGSAGTKLQQDVCIKTPNTPITSASQTAQCQAAFMLMHVTSQANIYLENTWGWVADHELDMGTRDQIDIFNGRGLLIESAQGPCWLYGTAFEHSVLYDYQFAYASNVFMGVIQHETAYFQGNPNALTPYTPNPTYSDPTFSDCSQSNCARTWGLRMVNSTSLFMYGAGLYNFFNNWDTANCLGSEACQERMVDIRNCSDIYLWALSTKGSQYLVSYEGTDVVPYSVNKGTFCDTIVLFELAATA